MPNVQTSYTETMRPAVAGMIANEEPNVLISRTIESAGGVGFGKIVQQGASDNGCVSDLDTTDMDEFRYLGITVRERSINPENTNGDQFAQRDSVRIMRKGVIWVAVAGAVTAGTDVTVTLATGVLGSAAPNAGTIVTVPRARWESSTAGAGLAKVRLD